MRLLQLDEFGEFSLVEYLDDVTLPPYAILSHTWGEDNDEVTFDDLTRCPRKEKVGYRKLHFCGEQAERDGLHHFWVDTCCIDKTNNTKLSEAITSMFRWYRNATKCYAYLADISTTDTAKKSAVSQPLGPAFRASRWFTRGWTLQELLAPSSIDFFSQEGTRLGDKISLEQQLHEVTNIPVQALQGAPLDEFSVDDRMSWAKNRHTKRGEDKAYSLLGIFNVSMSLLYGEGADKAFSRLLKEIHSDSPLDRLPNAVEAPFNSHTTQHESTCLENTRVEILRKIYDWADRKDEQCIFWLNGLAGTGKSTIARTVARRYHEQQRLAASFFFDRGGGDVGRASKFVTSIAAQLAQSVPGIRHYISNAIQERSSILSQSLRDQWHDLVLQPMSRLERPASFVLVVDALDECDDDNDIQVIVQLLSTTKPLKHPRLRVFLTSRPEVAIRHGIDRLSKIEHRDSVLHHIEPLIIDRDIKLFLEDSLKDIAKARRLRDDWPGVEVIAQLVLNASGLFIWAATACRFIREGRRFAARRLEAILCNSSGTAAAPEKHLNEIYVAVLKSSLDVYFTDEEREEQCSMLRYLLGSVVLISSPLSARSIGNLLNVPDNDVNQTLEDLSAILDIPVDKSQALRLHHPSFRDFLLDRTRCGEARFWVDERQAQEKLAHNCIQLISSTLKQYVCGINASGTLVADVKDYVQERLTSAVQYACLYWIQHLVKASIELCDHDQVHVFLKEHSLHWLEALGWMGKVSEGIYAVTALELLAAAGNSPQLNTFVYDIKRFALYGRAAIEQAPLQIYYSTLVFAPNNGLLKRQFAEALPTCIKRLPQTDRDWNALLQTLEGHSDRVYAVVFSPDGKLVVSASEDKTVRLWDAGTGTELHTLEGHLGYVDAVVFSPNGRLVASASGDNTVKLWDAVTGVELRTIDVTGYVSMLSFSDDASQLITNGGTFPTTLFCDERSPTLRRAPEISMQELWRVQRGENII